MTREKNLSSSLPASVGGLHKMAEKLKEEITKNYATMLKFQSEQDMTSYASRVANLIAHQVNFLQVGLIFFQCFPQNKNHANLNVSILFKGSGQPHQTG